jgi:hypothetical protein
MVFQQASYGGYVATEEGAVHHSSHAVCTIEALSRDICVVLYQDLHNLGMPPPEQQSISAT